jgi:hypothetical protein
LDFYIRPKLLVWFHITKWYHFGEAKIGLYSLSHHYQFGIKCCTANTLSQLFDLKIFNKAGLAYNNFVGRKQFADPSKLDQQLQIDLLFVNL